VNKNPKVLHELGSQVQLGQWDITVNASRGQG
jgi:hypothetical protein